MAYALPLAGDERAEAALRGRADGRHRVVVRLAGRAAGIRIARLRSGVDLDREVLAALRAAVDPVVRRALDRLPRNRHRLRARIVRRRTAPSAIIFLFIVLSFLNRYV